MRKVPTREERLSADAADTSNNTNGYSNGYSEVDIEKLINSVKKGGELAFTMGDSREMFPIRGNSNLISSASGSISDLLGRLVPRKRQDQIKKAQGYEAGDDLLNRLVDIKLNFTTMGMDLKAQPREPLEGNQQEVFQETLDQVELDLDLAKICEDLVKDWIVTDSMILYWRTDPVTSSGLSSDSSVPADEFESVGIPGVYDICTLNSSEVEWDNSLGQDILQLRIPAAVSDRINAAFDRARTSVMQMTTAEVYESLIKEGIGKKWIDAVRNRKDYVTLKREDGDNWLISTKERKGSGLASPCMRTIFLWLEERRMLSDGDFSGALMMKHFIMLIKQGESITQGPLAGQRTNWLTPAEAADLLKKFSGVTKALRVAVNHTTTIEFIFPPKELFNLEKYEKPELAIFIWSGITPTIVIGEGGKYASGFISIKRMVADIAKIREKVSLLFTNFFRHPTIAPKINTPKKTLVSMNFNSDVLKEPRQLLEEVKFMFQQSIMDHRTAASSLDRDPETLKASRAQTEREHEKGAWSPIGTQGLGAFGFQDPSLQDGGGRPPADGTTPNEGTRTQSPTASPTENT